MKWAIDSTVLLYEGGIGEGGGELLQSLLITPLVWLQKMKDTNPRLTRWYLALQLYAFHSQHQWGKD